MFLHCIVCFFGDLVLVLLPSLALASNHISRTSPSGTAITFGTIGLQNVGTIPATVNSTSISWSSLNPDYKYLISLNWLLGAGYGGGGGTNTVTVGTVTPFFTSAAGAIDTQNLINNPIPYNQATTVLYTYVVTPSVGGVITISSTPTVMISASTFGFDCFINQLDGLTIT